MRVACDHQASQAGVGDDRSAYAIGTCTGLPTISADLVVDLGVGLWAWPMPIDWDEDGDFDLVVSCPDVPFRGTYWFENPGGQQRRCRYSSHPCVWVRRLSNATLLARSTASRACCPRASRLVDFRAKRFGKQQTIYPQTNVHPNPVRANQWRYVDYDGERGST